MRFRYIPEPFLRGSELKRLDDCERHARHTLPLLPFPAAKEPEVEFIRLSMREHERFARYLRKHWRGAGALLGLLARL